MKRCSSDARSEGQPGDSLSRRDVRVKALIGRAQWETEQPTPL